MALLPLSTFATSELDTNWKSSVITGNAGSGLPVVAFHAPIRWFQGKFCPTSRRLAAAPVETSYFTTSGLEAPGASFPIALDSKRFSPGLLSTALEAGP